MNKINSIYIVLGLCCFSCSDSKFKEFDDTPISGEISIVVDETFKPIIDSQIFTFQSTYTRAIINPTYINEAAAFKNLLNDSSRLIIASRELNEQEKNYFKSLPLVPRVTRIAIDALALIAHPDNQDSVLSYNQVKQIFSSKIRSWKEINSLSKLPDIIIVFDHSNSSTARYAREIISENNELPKNCFAVNSNEEVINYCHDHPNALGIIGVNWVSDGDDPASKTFKNRIKVMAISPSDTSAGAGKAYKPYQAYIAQGFYPFTREIFIISREGRSGLGSGFASFVAGDKGQRIILKSGLMPATKPVRIVGFRNNE